jgi:hypothetical protein
MAEYIEREATNKYYVVRDKNTGLYFRGKGVNKWGKYYNQASIYRIKAHAENTVEEETRRGAQPEIVEIRIVEASADVVEVVRCSECQHWGGVTFGFVCRKFSGENTKICMHADGYCSYGERRSENES